MFAQLLRKFAPDQPRGKTVEGTNDGSFAPAGHHVQGGSGSPAKWKTYDLFKRISEKDGGFTYQPVTGEEAKEGFALSTYPQRSFAKDASEFKLTDLISYVAKNRDLFERKNHFLGGWHDPESGKIFLDVSVMTTDRKKAERLALKYDQIAYFDLGAGKSVTVNREATSGGAAKEEHDEAEATDAARADWIESYLAGGTGEDVHGDDRARADIGGDRGSEGDAGEAGLGFAHVLKYDPDQPRAPRGDPDGGKWVSEASRAGNPATSLMAAARTFTKEEAAVEGERILATNLTPVEAEKYKKHLDEINRALAEKQTSKALNTLPGTERYTAERRAWQNKEISELVHNAQSFATPPRGEKPTVLVLGGRGGSGKSSFGTYVKNGVALGIYNENKFLKLDTDEFKTLLAQHDGVAMTDSLGQPSVGWRAALYHDESADMFDKAVVLARHTGLNVVLDVTLRSAHNDRVALFQKAGYRVEGYYMHLPPSLAAERAVHRARDGGTMNGRLVPPSYVLTSDKNEKSFESLMPKFDKWAVYSNDVPRGQTPKLVAKGEKKRAEEGFAHIIKAGTSEGAYKAWETIKAKYPEKFNKAIAAKLLKTKVSDLDPLTGEDEDGKTVIVGYRAKSKSGYISMDYLKEHIKVEAAKEKLAAINAGTPVNKPIVELAPKQLDLIPGGSKIAYAKDVSNNSSIYGKLDRQSVDMWQTLPQATQKAIRNYTSNGYKEINRYLGGQNEQPSEYTRVAIKNLDALMNNSTIPAHIQVTRGMAVGNLVDSFPDLKGMRFGGNEKHNENLRKSLVGRTYTEKAFVSTTLNNSVYSYSDAAGETGRIPLKINVPRGSPGYFIGDRSAHPGENEVLLPRNSQFLIRRLTSNGGLEVDYLG